MPRIRSSNGATGTDEAGRPYIADYRGEWHPVRPCARFRPDRTAEGVIAPGEEVCLCGWHWKYHAAYASNLAARPEGYDGPGPGLVPEA